MSHSLSIEAITQRLIFGSCEVQGRHVDPGNGEVITLLEVSVSMKGR